MARERNGNLELSDLEKLGFTQSQIKEVEYAMMQRKQQQEG